MFSVRLLLRWSATSHEGALANARAAAVLAARARVERAEVAAYVEACVRERAVQITDRAAGAGAGAR